MKDIFGWTPLPTKRVSPRWILVSRDPCPITTFKRIGSDLVSEVDKYVNKTITYKGEAIDEWSPPRVTYARKWGDCEDIALLKRALLIKHGVPDQDIIFLIVNDLISRGQHAVIVTNGRVLDTFNSLTLKLEQVTDYVPIQAFAADKAWTFGKRKI